MIEMERKEERKSARMGDRGKIGVMHMWVTICVGPDFGEKKRKKEKGKGGWRWLIWKTLGGIGLIGNGGLGRCHVGKDRNFFSRRSGLVS